ncbi:CBO0543 family protein [Metabacillus halosaccharovorans]|uniref:CBO0543 family protein n=1 Tax=Metabacillus halosaccharovorans TaxID=930124 RepID=UPI001C1F69A1|nr:CBO0543 family protein [Metabacillus halosaccharovorans]MBU7594790.1 hypothetical protein [Metabacillus halosaccharovorans]
MNPSLQDIMKAQEKVSSLRWYYWRDEIVFTPQWWFMLIFLIILIFVWIRILDHSRIFPILLYGLLTFNIATVLDTFGGELQLWEYPKMVLPWGPRVICIDVMIALFFMMLYQFFVKWKTFIFASIFLSGIFAFVFEPVAMYLGIYKPLIWSNLYSFPIYFLLAISIRGIVEKIRKLSTGS